MPGQFRSFTRGWGSAEKPRVLRLLCLPPPLSPSFLCPFRAVPDMVAAGQVFILDGRSQALYTEQLQGATEAILPSSLISSFMVHLSTCSIPGAGGIRQCREQTRIL